MKDNYVSKYKNVMELIIVKQYIKFLCVFSWINILGRPQQTENLTWCNVKIKVFSIDSMKGHELSCTVRILRYIFIYG